MSGEKKSLWYRLWDHKSKKEKSRLVSFIPLILYTIAFMYGILYLSILSSVNRYKSGEMVKTWYGGDKDEVIAAREREKQDIEESFNHLRKRMTGGR